MNAKFNEAARPPGSTGTEIRLLGPMALERGGRPVELPPSRKARALLAYLLMTPQAVARSSLCELLWDDTDDPRAELRWGLSRIRSLFAGDAQLIAHEDTVRLDASACHVDATAVDDAIGGARAGEVDLELCRALLALFRGDLLQGLEVDGSPHFSAWLTDYSLGGFPLTTINRIPSGCLRSHSSSRNPSAGFPVKNETIPFNTERRFPNRPGFTLQLFQPCTSEHFQMPFGFRVLSVILPIRLIHRKRSTFIKSTACLASEPNRRNKSFPAFCKSSAYFVSSSISRPGERFTNKSGDGDPVNFNAFPTKSLPSACAFIRSRFPCFMASVFISKILRLQAIHPPNEEQSGFRGCVPSFPFFSRNPFFFIVSGTVQVIREHGRDSKVIAELDAGDTFGEIALISNQPRTGTVRAVTDVEVCTIHKSDFDHLLEHSPDLNRTSREMVEARLLDMKQKGADYAYINVTTTGVSLILRDAKKLGLSSKFGSNPYGFSEALVAVAGAVAEGVTGVVPHAPFGNEVPGMKKLVDFHRAKHPNDTHDLMYVRGWSYVEVWTEALRRADCPAATCSLI